MSLPHPTSTAETADDEMSSRQQGLMIRFAQLWLTSLATTFLLGIGSAFAICPCGDDICGGDSCFPPETSQSCPADCGDPVPPPAGLIGPAVVTISWDKATLPAPMASQLFEGWTPDFSVNVPGFDSLNRAYIRDRHTFMDSIPGTIKRLRFGAWEERSFKQAVRTELCPAGDCNVCFLRGGGEYNAQIVFDRDDRAYTVVHAFTAPSTYTCPNVPSPPDGAARDAPLVGLREHLASGRAAVRGGVRARAALLAGAAGRGMFGIRVKTGHKNTAQDLRTGKTTACMMAHVGFHSPISSICVEAGVRKRCCQLVIQHTVFTRMRQHRSSVREGLRFWTDLPVAGNYTYPEHTPT
jgi:hypothetical protein